MNLKEVAVRSGISALSRPRDLRLCMGHEVYTFSLTLSSFTDCPVSVGPDAESATVSLSHLERLLFSGTPWHLRPRISKQYRPIPRSQCVQTLYLIFSLSLMESGTDLSSPSIRFAHYHMLPLLLSNRFICTSQVGPRFVLACTSWLAHGAPI